MTPEASALTKLFYLLEQAQVHAAALPNSRERSVVVTKLDEARLWAREAGERGLLIPGPSERQAT